jgi:hypothetical protein
MLSGMPALRACTGDLFEVGLTGMTAMQAKGVLVIL